MSKKVFNFGCESLAILVLTVLVVGSADADENWPQWRGAKLNGVSNSTGLAAEWSLEKNIVWKTAMPAWSGSTPIIWGDKVFVMSPGKVEESAANEGDKSAGEKSERPRGRGGRRGRGGGRRGGFSRGPASPGGQNLMLMCISKKDGTVLWEKKLDEGNRVMMKHNQTSPSPVTDGKHVWTVTGNGQVTAFDFDGKEVWKLNLQKKYGDFGLNWGYASSPLLFDGKLIIEVLHGTRTTEPSYLVAFDASSGEELWKVNRETDAPRESPDAYTTPIVLEQEGKSQIVVSGGDYVTGHDPENGKELWRASGLNPTQAGNFRICGTPVISDGVIFAPSRKKPVLAIKTGGTGDVTDNIVWQFTGRGGPDVPSPVTDGKRLYLVDDSGIVTCLDNKTGEIVWGPERTATGTVSASPLLADGKLFITNEKGVTTVLSAGDSYKQISTNTLDESYTLSSIAVSDSQLFIRTEKALYCIGQK